MSERQAKIDAIREPCPNCNQAAGITIRWFESRLSLAAPTQNQVLRGTEMFVLCLWCLRRTRYENVDGQWALTTERFGGDTRPTPLPIKSTTSELSAYEPYADNSGVTVRSHETPPRNSRAAE